MLNEMRELARRALEALEETVGLLREIKMILRDRDRA